MLGCRAGGAASHPGRPAHARVEPEVCRDREHTGLQAYGGAAVPASTAGARWKKGRKSEPHGPFPPPCSPCAPPVFPVGSDATSTRGRRSAGAPWTALLLKNLLSSISCSLCPVSPHRTDADRRDPNGEEQFVQLPGIRTPAAPLALRPPCSANSPKAALPPSGGARSPPSARLPAEPTVGRRPHGSDACH
jgi:hypothetical protein